MEEKQFLNESAIEKFYLDGSVLIAGATGFLGRALLAKLLRSVTGIKYIYILIRPKRNCDISERFKSLMNDPIFKDIEFKNPELLKKVVPVYGDVTHKSLGLNRIDEDNIINNVTVVFHLAATIRFNETLADAFKTNTIGTNYLVEFSRNIKHIKAFVYVSTAYSNSDKCGKIYEQIYDPPCDVNRLIKAWQDDPNKFDDLAKEIKSNHINTYTLTKNMAEWVVMERVNFCAAVIVRPSIVTAAWKEPKPGWVIGLNGMTGMIAANVVGTLRFVLGDVDMNADIIPVDIVVNTLIVSAWHAVKKTEEKVQIYNCTSGSLNKFTYADVEKFTFSNSIELPTNKLILYPSLKFTKYRRIYCILDLLFHFLPCLLLDVFGFLCGSKLSWLKVYRKVKSMAQSVEHFTLNEWDFECKNQTLLKTDLPGHDRETFETDIRLVNWSMYFKKYVLGIRTYILKDPIDNLPIARVKLNRLYYLQRSLQIGGIICIYLTLFMLINILC